MKTAVISPIAHYWSFHIQSYHPFIILKCNFWWIFSLTFRIKIYISTNFPSNIFLAQFLGKNHLFSIYFSYFYFFYFYENQIYTALQHQEFFSKSVLSLVVLGKVLYYPFSSTLRNVISLPCILSFFLLKTIAITYTLLIFG